MQLAIQTNYIDSEVGGAPGEEKKVQTKLLFDRYLIYFSLLFSRKCKRGSDFIAARFN
jgi:hypothetical protein